MTTKMIVKLRRFLHEGFYMFSYAVRPVTCFFVLLLSAAAQEDGNLTVDNLTVTKDADVYGQLNVGFIMGTNATVLATGGTITTVNTTGGIYRVHTFTNVGTTNFVVTGGPLVCEVLVVAGGGAGASSSSGIGSGGGAGGVIYMNAFVVSGENTVTVGQGGVGAIAGFYGQGGENGGISVFSSLTAIGGGHGKGWGTYDLDGAGNGGSGGGGTLGGGPGPNPGTGTPGQGHDGGTGRQDGPYTTGGGGGAGSVGGNGVSTKSGDGGIGIACSISGEEKYYGGGGGGGIWSGYYTLLWGSGGLGGGGDGARTIDGEDGEPNTGGGGGGTGNVGEEGAGPYSYGGDGGSGVVIVRYSITSAGYVSALSISSNGISQTDASATNVFMGKVGIGTETPEEKLHVSENVRIDGALTFGNETRTNWPSGGVAVGALIATNNLADLTDVAAARTNLGLGTAATNDASAFDAAGEAAAVGSDLTTHTGDFNNPHQVTAAQVGAISTNAGALLAVNNLSELSATAATARSNLGLRSAATNEVSAFLSTGGGNVNGNVSVSGSVSVDAPSGDIPMGMYTNQ